MKPIGDRGAATAWLPGHPAARPGDSKAAAAAVSELYALTAPGLIRLAYVILSDRQAAEDVVQDAFYNLCRRFGG